MHRLRQLFQELYRFQVLAPAVFVRQPAPIRATVIEIEHRGDRINAQAINVAFLNPEERVGDQKIAHRIAPIVEDVRAPIWMLAFAWIEMFIECRAVEAPKRESVFRKVCWHPIHDHAEAAPVQIVNEKTKIVRRAEARGRRIVVRNLIAPRATVWMTLERQEDIAPRSKSRPIAHFLAAGTGGRSALETSHSPC